MLDSFQAVTMLCAVCWATLERLPNAIYNEPANKLIHSQLHILKPVILFFYLTCTHRFSQWSIWTRLFGVATNFIPSGDSAATRVVCKRTQNIWNTYIHTYTHTHVTFLIFLSVTSFLPQTWQTSRTKTYIPYSRQYVGLCIKYLLNEWPVLQWNF